MESGNRWIGAYPIYHVQENKILHVMKLTPQNPCPRISAHNGNRREQKSLILSSPLCAQFVTCT